MQQSPEKQEAKPEPEFKVLATVTEFCIKPNLRNREESIQRLQEQLTILRTVGSLGCPFHMDCYTLIKKSEEEYVVKVAKPTSNLEAYLRKDVAIKIRLSLINNILDALIVLEERQLVCSRVSLSYVELYIQEGSPIARLPIHELWKVDKGSNDLLNNSLQVYLADHKSEMGQYPPELQRKSSSVDLRQMQLWMLSLTILQLLWLTEPLKIDYTTKGSKYCLEQCNIDSTKLEPIVKKHKFYNEQACLKLVEANLEFNWQKRKASLTELKKAFQLALREEHRPPVKPLDTRLVSQFIDKHQQDKQLEYHRTANFQSNKFTLMDEQLSNRLALHFESCKKPLSKPDHFKPFYKASENGFSSQHFHQKCDTVRHLLIVFQTTDKHKFCAYSPVAFDLNVLEGIFGSYLPDYSHESFLYANGEFFHLKDRSKAIGVAANHGPIFGETDIVTVDRNLVNLSRLKSYQPKTATGKPKLLPHENYHLAEYEVYNVCFHQPQ